jgi:hypothetical protein
MEESFNDTIIHDNSSPPSSDLNSNLQTKTESKLESKIQTKNSLKTVSQIMDREEIIQIFLNNNKNIDELNEVNQI